MERDTELILPDSTRAGAAPISTLNKFGQLSTLFAQPSLRTNLTLAETVLIETVREMIATETNPDASVDFDSWAWLKIEVGARVEGNITSEFDRKANPIGFLAVEAVALWIESERERDAEKRNQPAEDGGNTGAK